MSEEEFEHTVVADLYESYCELLLRPSEVIKRMRPCGNPQPALGDGVLALPTLVYRGPGGSHTPGAAGRSRRVLFFTLRPKYLDRLEGTAGAYDEDGQVHAAWLLWRTQELPESAANAAATRSMYKTLGHSLAAYESDE